MVLIRVSLKTGHSFGPQGPGDSSDVMRGLHMGFRWIGMMRDSQGESTGPCFGHFVLPGGL